MPPTSKDDAVASCGKMDTANNVDAYHIIMQSELLTDHCTLRTGLGNDDDISTNDSVVEQLTYSNGLLQNLRETVGTKCKICHHDLLISSAIPIRLKECKHNKVYHLHCIREVAASMLMQVQLLSQTCSVTAAAPAKPNMTHEQSSLGDPICNNKSATGRSTSGDVGNTSVVPAGQSKLPPNSDTATKVCPQPAYMAEWNAYRTRRWWVRIPYKKCRTTNYSSTSMYCQSN